MSGGAHAEDGTVYGVPGGRSYHFAGCPIIEGKSAQGMALAEAMQSGLTSCKLCGLD
jgi:hypothetical protein